MVDNLNIPLPTWLTLFEKNYQACADIEAQMRFVIQAASKNIDMGTGGPFAAGVFQQDNHALVALGVNLVPSTGLSILHAEMLAISLAQQQLGTYDLRGHRLVCSAEPCSMCFGALPWSGISELVCAAADADVRAIGFDEGDKLPNWQQALEQRGIRVINAMQREAAVQVLKSYQQHGGEIYNSNAN